MVRNHLGATRIVGPDETSKILLVGEMNPLSADPDYALYHLPHGCAGNRLQSKILGVVASRHYLTMWRTNLCTGSWELEYARARAAELVGSKVPWDVVIMLGVKVEHAFSKVTGIKVDPFTSRTVAGIHLAKYTGLPGESYNTAFTFVSLPHPSGRNTSWNDRENITRARRLITKIAPRVPWGELDKEKEQHV